MGTKKNGTEKPAAPSKTNGMPEGYSNASERFEPAGFWLPEAGAIHGGLVGAYEFRQKTGRGKGQVRRVYVLKLVQECAARVKVLDGNGKPMGFDEAVLKKGELCGVFATPGLRDLENLAGCLVYVQRLPEEQKKETERGLMWMYDIGYKGTKRPLPVRAAPAERVKGEPADDGGDASFDYADAF